jgi:mevalonate kinase
LRKEKQDKLEILEKFRKGLESLTERKFKIKIKIIMGKYINKNSNGTGLGSSASDKINRFRRRNNYQHSC